MRVLAQFAVLTYYREKTEPMCRMSLLLVANGQF